MRWMQKRYIIEIGLAALSLTVFVATLIWSEWIEIIFGVDPDQGDGSIEWLIIAMATVSALVAILLARSDRRRLRASEGGARWPRH